MNITCILTSRENRIAFLMNYKLPCSLCNKEIIIPTKFQGLSKLKCNECVIKIHGIPFFFDLGRNHEEPMFRHGKTLC